MSGDPALSWDCDECSSAGMSEARGCDGHGDYRTRIGQRLEGCPRSWLAARDAEAELVNDAFDHVRTGILPCSGGLLDQSPLFDDVVAIVRREADVVRSCLDKLNQASQSGSAPKTGRHR